MQLTEGAEAAGPHGGRSGPSAAPPSALPEPGLTPKPGFRAAAGQLYLDPPSTRGPASKGPPHLRTPRPDLGSHPLSRKHHAMLLAKSRLYYSSN